MKLNAVIFCLMLLSCNQHANNNLQTKIDSLQSVIDKSYKPGLGEFMSNIQVHHAKLWFAGQNRNWQLADFEINEIKEALQGIKDYCSDRPEVRSIGLIEPAIDSVSASIGKEDPVLFKDAFIQLTNSCNNCHKQTAHGFNVIQIPDTPPFSNQKF